MQQIFTANRLTDGIVVYLTATGEWSADIADSFVCANEHDLQAHQDRAERAAKDDKVVEPYTIDVETSPSGPRPTRYREVIRAFGPSIAFGADAQEQTNVPV